MLRLLSMLPSGTALPRPGSSLEPQAVSAAQGSPNSTQAPALDNRNEKALNPPSNPSLLEQSIAPSTEPRPVASIQEKPCPLTLDPQIPWVAMQDVQKLPHGKTTGAYELSFSGHPHLVAKFCNDASQQAFSMALAKSIGISAPRVHLIRPNSAEMKSLIGSINNLPKNSDMQELMGQLTQKKSPVLLMEYLKGSSLKSRTSYFSSEAPLQPSLLLAIGKLAAFDLVLGNLDRFENFDSNECLGGTMDLPENFANVFLVEEDGSPTDVAAIDTSFIGSANTSNVRTIYSRSVGGRTEESKPNEIMKSVLNEPETQNIYICSNIVGMLQQALRVTNEEAKLVQQGFVDGLKLVARKVTKDHLKSVVKSLNLGDAIPVDELNERLDELRSFVGNTA